MGAPPSAPTLLVGALVAIWSQTGTFVNGVLRVVEELVRSVFVGFVYAFNRSLHGMVVGLSVDREKSTDSGRRPRRVNPGHAAGAGASVRRKPSHSDLFGASSLNFLHGLGGDAIEVNDRGDGGGGRELENHGERTRTADPKPPQARFPRRRSGNRDTDLNVEGGRGLLEDVHFAVETVISVVFQSLRDVVSTVFVLHTPTEKEERARRRQRKQLKRRLRRWQKFYTFDAGDAIVKSGYPLQEFDVVTQDGYHLQLQRIPNKGKKAVVFMHGVLDTSLTWVSQRIGSTRGSVAFAAYEAGLDVWLLNTRANWPQRNDTRKKSEFWRFSANELALQDVHAQISFVRRKKASEGDTDCSVKAVGHSLGGACLLMYAVHKKLAGEDHHIDRLVLLSPAGFHSKIPVSLLWAKYVFPALSGMLDLLAPACGVGLGLRTPMLRFLIFKLLADVENHSVFRELFTVLFRAVFGGDSSSWTTIVTMPHYNKRSMPMISLHLASHFAQWARTGSFSFFDGGAMWNEGRYGARKPPSVVENYGVLADLPVNVVGGTSDGLIPADMSYLHYVSLLDAGVRRASYAEFDYGHLDFVMGGEGSAELGRYVLDVLLEA